MTSALMKLWVDPLSRNVRSLWPWSARHGSPCAMCIRMEDIIFFCFGINLGGFDLILGVDYLRTLSPILWDFEDLYMSLWWANRRVL